MEVNYWYLAFKSLEKLIVDVGLMLAFHCDQYSKFLNSFGILRTLQMDVMISSSILVIIDTKICDFDITQ